MKRIDFKKDALPHLIAILSFIILTIIYFKPVVFEHKSIKQYDILQHLGGAQEVIEYREKYKEEPLWTNSMFSGMPAYLVSTLHKGEIIQKFANAIFGLFPHPAGLVLVHLICFYILLLTFGVRPIYASIGAIAFAFASYNFISIEAGHNSKIRALGYAPLVLAGVILVFRKRYFIGFIVTAIGIALNIGSNHYQITYYLCFILGILGLVEFIFAIKEKLLANFFKKIGILILAAVIGLSANFSSFLTIYEYSKYTMRGGSELKPKENAAANVNAKGLEKEYAFNWSYGVFETFSLLIPNVQGGASQGSLDKNSNFYKTLLRNNVPEDQANQYIASLPLYWGDQPGTAGPTYFGAIICFLFVLGLLLLDSKTRIWLLTATIVSIVLSWGKNFPSFNYLVFDYFPAYNKFRSVSWTLVIAQICVPLGALLGLHKALESKFSKPLLNKLLIAFGITGGLCLLFGLFSGMASFRSPVDEQVFGQAPWAIEALKKDREALFRSDAFRSFFLILIAAGLVWAVWKEKLSKTIALSIIGLLVTFDIWTVDKRYLNDENFEKRVSEQHFAPTEADQFVLEDKSSYRVINLLNPWNDARPSYYHSSIGGYSGAKMQRYQDIIDRHLSDETARLIQNLQKGVTDFSSLPVLNMLNTKYFMFGNSQREVLKNDNALGNAWYVKEIKSVKTPDEEISSLSSIDPKTAAVLDESKFKMGKNTFSLDSSSTITLKKYEPNNLLYEAQNSSPGFAVFSEIYYPKGWYAYIDGKEAPIVRVNYILRGLEIPQGKHKIEFKFMPESYKIGNTIAMIASIFLILCIIAAVFYMVKGRKDNILKEESSSK